MNNLILRSQFGNGFQYLSNAWSPGSDTNDGVLQNLELFISSLLGIVTVLASLYFIVNFLLAALSWVTAGGDSGKVSTATQKMVQSTIGLIVVVGAYAIVGLIGSILGLDILNPATTLGNILLP